MEARVGNPPSHEPHRLAHRRIAVVAVHGVADQQACQSARQIAALLQGAAPGAYEAFEETSIRVPVEPMALASPPPTPSLRTLSPLEERTTRFRSPARRRGESAPQPDVHLDFFLDQVEHYRPTSGQVYETPRLRSVRGGGAPDRSVEVFEIYWADLSRLGITSLRIFGELFQIIVHLASLGRHALDQATTSHPLGRGWSAFVWCHRWAVRLLTLPAILCILLLLTLIPAAWMTRVPAAGAGRALALLAGLLVAAMGLFLLRGRHRALGAFAFGGATAALVSRLDLASPGLLLFWLGFFAALAAYFGIAVLYNRRRPGATLGAAAILISVALVLVAIGGWPPSLLLARDREALQGGVLDLAEAVFLTNGLVWALFTAFQLASWALGFVWRASGAAAQAARRSRWTAHLTLASTATALLLSGFVLWAAILPWFLPVLPAGDHTPQWPLFRQAVEDFARWDPVCRPPAAPDLARCTSAAQTARTFVFASASWVLVWVLLLVGGGLLLVIWGILPSALWESRLGRLALRQPDRLGLWLDSAYRAATASGLALLLSIGLLYPAGLVLQLLGASPIADKQRTQALITLIGGGLAATTAALFALRGRAKRLALGLRSPLDALLDVDNHLRMHPLDANPRAQIATRATAFLRHLTRQRFDAIILVTHSQGTVIAADLLRFLARHPDPALRDLPEIHLFTMGSPLRQAYALRFPDLYAWARHENIGPIAERAPDPASLYRVKTWTNAYTSGDYVGRHLWRNDDDETRFSAGLTTDDGDAARPWKRREFCLGAGAHTHYWDGSFAEVGATLDELVRSA